MPEPLADFKPAGKETARGQLVSIVIPCRNEEKNIGRCLDSILSSTYPIERLEILVVDGMSEDRTREVVSGYAKRYPVIELLENPKRSQPAALNIGIRRSRGNFIIRMDAHSAFGKDSIEQCVRYLSETEADNVGGRIVAKSRDATLVGKAIALVMSERFGVGNSHFRLAPKEQMEPRWVKTVPYSCYRREVFDKVGFFNENIERSEDAEFHMRMRNQGCRTLFAPGIVNDYFTRSDLKSFWSHAVDNGIWLALPFQWTRQMNLSFRHWAPFLFTGLVAALAAVSLVSQSVRGLLALICAGYALADLGVSVWIAKRKKNFRLAFILPLIFAMLHFGYGIGTWMGMTKVALAKMKTSQEKDGPC